MPEDKPVYLVTALNCDGVKKRFSVYKKGCAFFIVNELGEEHMAPEFRHLTPKDVKEEIAQNYGVSDIELTVFVEEKMTRQIEA
jgi:hypothetical protein